MPLINFQKSSENMYVLKVRKGSHLFPKNMLLINFQESSENTYGPNPTNFSPVFNVFFKCLLHLGTPGHDLVSFCCHFGYTRGAVWHQRTPRRVKEHQNPKRCESEWTFVSKGAPKRIPKTQVTPKDKPKECHAVPKNNRK